MFTIIETLRGGHDRLIFNTDNKFKAEQFLCRMLNFGVNAYLMTDLEPSEIKSMKKSQFFEEYK